MSGFFWRKSSYAMIPIYYSQDMSIPKWRRIESRGETREYFDKHQSEYPVQKGCCPILNL